MLETMMIESSSKAKGLVGGESHEKSDVLSEDLVEVFDLPSSLIGLPQTFLSGTCVESPAASKPSKPSCSGGAKGGGLPGSAESLG